ncbi:MAG: hypothetical protein HUJ75_00115 [Parasporobacterium sp.]|nr:hypothetical protein [Parasporobacterium sp.]
MINFDEEIKKFHPSLEVDEVEKVAKSENAATDFVDLMLEVMNADKKEY